MKDMPGHLARRFQQIAVAVFLAEVEAAGFDLTPVQYAALAAIAANPSIDQITLAGLIAYDRTTITGVIDRLAQKGLVVRQASARDRRSRELLITDEGRRTLDAITPAVEYMLSEDAPTRTIMGAGAGSFAVIKILESEGINLPESEWTPDGVAAHFKDISDMSTAKALQGAFEQTQKYVAQAAARAGIKL